MSKRKKYDRRWISWMMKVMNLRFGPNRQAGMR